MDEMTKEQKHREYLRKIPEFVLMDDTFMNACFNEQPKLVQTVLRIIMDKPDLIVKSAQIQKVLKNLHGHSVTLDVDATDNDEKKYGIEIQNNNDGAKPKRARFISSMIDGNVLDPGDDYEGLPESYVIFITENDVLKKGKPVYHIRRTVEGDEDVFDDRTHIIYVNASVQDDTPLGRLMHDFHCKRAEDMYNRDIAERVDMLKNTEGGKRTMCKIMEEIADREREEGKREGKIEGKIEEKRETVFRFLEMGERSLEKIAKVCGLSVDTVTEIADSFNGAGA